jgi:hypothetical protein
MDLSKLSTEDLMALKGGDLSKVSTEGLQALKHSSIAQQIDNDPISQGARDVTGGMSGLDKFRAGMGKAFYDLTRGAGQLVGAVSREDVAESRRLDAPLMDTGAGVAGNLVGNVAPLALTAAIPGANTVVGAGIVGAGAGLLQPSTSTRETLTNVGLGAAGGAGGQYVANKVPALLQGRVDKATTAQAGNAQKFNAARSGAKEGYVVPPADLEPGALSEAVSGLSGKIKTAQVASQRNQQVTNRLARESIGLKAGDQLDDTALQAIRNQAATQGYAPIRGAGTVQADKQFADALDKIVATRTGAARSFPGLGKTNMHGQPVDEIADLVNSVKLNQFDAGDAVDATRVLRDSADKAYRQGDREMGKAAKGAADAIEGMLERHLQAAGNPDALKAFRDARTLIAKTYSVQKGLNSQTGDVAANKLAEQLAKGKPLSDELRTIAETAQAFPKATQMLKEAPKAVSPLDFAVATTAGMSTGNPLAALMLGARPLARNALLSGPVQARAMQQSAPVPFTQATQRLLENRLAQMLLGPAGAAGTLQLGQ